MKKSGIINAELMKALTLARHGHMITICDAGFPIPKGEDIIDLSLTAGIPSFFDTLKAVLNEIIEMCIRDRPKDHCSVLTARRRETLWQAIQI